MQTKTGWTLLHVPIQFNIQADTKEVHLKQLPPLARKVKLHICLQSGACNGDAIVTWTLYTMVDIMKIVGHPYNQNSWTVYSQNCSLRLDDRQVIEVTRAGNFPNGNFSISVEVLGYK